MTLSCTFSSPLSCITSARQFDAREYLPFTLAGQRVGWVRAAHAPQLNRWPDIFVTSAAGIGLTPRCDTDVQTRSDVLSKVIDELASEGWIPGWRNETYAIRNTFDDAPLAYIERAASRFFGTMTYAVHLNGIVAGPIPRLWIARRSHTKATDPGMLDNIVAGGIGWGLSVSETLLKECWEEAGIEPQLAASATPGRIAYVVRSIPEGAQVEQVFIYDLLLPETLIPCNQDGEVSEHQLVRVDEVARWIEAGALTIDASLATLDCLLRNDWLDSHARQTCVGIETLFSPAVF